MSKKNSCAPIKLEIDFHQRFNIKIIKIKIKQNYWPLVKETMKRTFELITIDSLKTLPDATKMCSQITLKAFEKFGHDWHCFVYNNKIQSFTQRFSQSMKTTVRVFRREK